MCNLNPNDANFYVTIKCLGNQEFSSRFLRQISAKTGGFQNGVEFDIIFSEIADSVMMKAYIRGGVDRVKKIQLMELRI